ncbi:MAG: hypothetical protein IPG55_10350 [Saprospiraceae bacterium]|nr:hypothetical protein [Candidatus Defluviibacterium haderslevense]
MQKFILILIYLTLGTFINGQNRSLGTLSMVQRPNPSGAVTRSSVDSVKYKKALKVYNKLVEARGDLRYPVPNLIMSKSEDAVASMDYKKMTIDLEEKHLMSVLSLEMMPGRSCNCFFIRTRTNPLL